MHILAFNLYSSMFNCDRTMHMPLPLPRPSPANLNLTALFKEGRLKEALHFLLTTHNPPVDCSTYLQLLHTCIAKNALSQGKQFHSFIAHRGFAFAVGTIFQNKLLSMYVNCGDLVDGRKVFEDMKEQDSFSWNAIIAAYRRRGFPREALKMFYQMQGIGVQPNKLSFSNLLPACAKIRALKEGMEIHKSIIEGGVVSDVVISTSLVDMYAKCGIVHKARKLFDKMPLRNVVSWNAMISGYAQNGDLDEAFRLFKEMPLPDSISWNAMVAGYAQNGPSRRVSTCFRRWD